MATIQFDMLSSGLHRVSSSIRSFASIRSLPRATAHRLLFPPPLTSFLALNAFSTDSSEAIIKLPDKPSICTADELHYVSVSNSDWRLALWRYHPCPAAPPRNHPLLLLSGVGTNAIGYDLCTTEGFETWILEVRGAGLSIQGSNSRDIEQRALEKSENMETASESATNAAIPSEQKLNNIPYALPESDISTSERKEPENCAVDGDLTGLATVWDESKLVTRLTETFMQLSERVSGFLSESQSRVMSAKLLDQISKLLVDSPFFERFDEIRGKLSTLLEARQSSGVTSQISDLSEKLVNIIEEGQRSLSPRFLNLQERFTSTLEDFQKQLDLMVKYDWDFDHYLEEDVPAAMEYILKESKPKDGKLLAIGHSMGGILLYAMLSRFGFEGKEPRLAAIVTLASSLDYTSSKSTLKLLLPLADPAQALNVPVVPLGALLAAAYPLTYRPPYVLSWLNSLITAEDMMEPELLKKLILSNFCTIPAKLILQLTTAFRDQGLCNRDGTFFYKDHLHKSNVPVLAIAGDQDLICPPEAVEETVKLIPQHLVTYKVFGEADGPHYAHYDLVGGRLAVKQVYPCIIEFLKSHDK
ncbi:uncharacterized protein LOC129321925 isoform X2 [Prosopis cineraria]|uniref:uncharacterized protein LOC129321925 isoform X2 n=1 Tax=Prosopis cineraria TaxID=364024 RepID=UPI00240FC9F3|nr:uncharacterized protein LOC129321925 isoform X2 [Prosopis cineraria]